MNRYTDQQIKEAKEKIIQLINIVHILKIHLQADILYWMDI